MLTIGIPWPFYLCSFLLQVILLNFNICTQFYIKCVKKLKRKPVQKTVVQIREGFSAQDGARQKLKICPELSGNKLSESVFKNSGRLSVAQTATKNIRVLNFLENDKIIFHLAAMSHTWDSAHADQVKFTASEVQG